eukprot:jgi/Chlat1/5514/Chrsp360S05325
MEGQNVDGKIGNSTGNHTALLSSPVVFLFLGQGSQAIGMLKADRPVKVKCSAAVSLSLGEYTALVLAGALSFENALKVACKVVRRAWRQWRSPAARARRFRSSALTTPTYALSLTRRRAFPDTVLKVANYLFSQSSVVSRHKAALDASGKLAIPKGHACYFSRVDRARPAGSTFRALLQASKENMLEVGS